MMRNLSNSSRRARASCSVLALATVLVVGPSPAIAAGSFQGAGTVTTGSATITTGTTTTNITVSTPQTVIRWDPTDTAAGGGSINFQPAGTTATFAGSGNYAVLNRIIPTDQTRSISLNGTIVTSAPVGLPGASNGSLYFYTPGGFVLGSGASINVGSLVLSASPLAQDVSGNFISGLGTTNHVVFGQALQPGASIVTNAGSQINASGTDAYVAVVAPSITHNGAITVNGSAALVAAEAATINFSTDGLFDIQVDAGTTSASGIATAGDIGGSASTGSTDNRRIFMVAVPKNQAMTMVISNGADLGFAIAGAANIDGNAIVLSAGHDIVDGAASYTRSLAHGTGSASIGSNNLNTTSALFGTATKNIILSADGTATLASDLTLKAVDNINVLANGSNSLFTIKGDVNLSLDKVVGAGGTGGAAGVAAFYAAGGRLTAEKNVTVTANTTGADSAVAGVNGGNATGGAVRVQAQTAGQLTILGNLVMKADGTGGGAAPEATGVTGGNGTGGAMQFQTFDANSKVSVTGNVSISSRGTGGSSTAAGSAGGTGTGGFQYIGAGTANSQLTVGGALSGSSDGQGGFAYGLGVNGGLGQGGQISIFANGSAAKATFNGGASMSASGTGGDAGGEGCNSCNGIGGAGTGGTVQFTTGSGALGTALTINGGVMAMTEGRGGFGIGGGGAGLGGRTAATYGANSAILFTGNVDFSARGYGGYSYDSTGGSGTGGRDTLGSQNGAAGGSLTVTGAVETDVSGFGGAAYGLGNGGAGTGGLTDNGGSIGTVDFRGDFTGWAAGHGGYADSGTGGSAVGGRGWVDAFGASVHIGGDYSMDSGAQGGSGPTGGNATGGQALLLASAGATLTLDGNAAVYSNAFGGGASESGGVLGGNATGGTARIQSTTGTGTAGTITIGGGATISAEGTGGSAVTGGKGTGGSAQLFASAGSIAISDGEISGGASLSADGYGGYGTSGKGGGGFGGLANVFAASGTSLTIFGVTE
ncbi:MAG: hypothetical protein ABIN83_03075, partial [Sphingomicrobium sp.]